MRLLILPVAINQSNFIWEYGPNMHPSVWIYHIHMYTNSSDSASSCQSHLPMGPLPLYILGTNAKLHHFCPQYDIKLSTLSYF